MDSYNRLSSTVKVKGCDQQKIVWSFENQSQVDSKNYIDPITGVITWNDSDLNDIEELVVVCTSEIDSKVRIKYTLKIINGDYNPDNSNGKHNWILYLLLALNILLLFLVSTITAFKKIKTRKQRKVVNKT